MTEHPEPQHAAAAWHGDKAAEPYVLLLFVAGMTPRSTRAIANLTRICETYLSGRYSLEIIDVYQQPEQTRAEQVVAAPTLIRVAPAPRLLLIGDLSDTARVLAGLEIIQHTGGQDG